MEFLSTLQGDVKLLLLGGALALLAGLFSGNKKSERRYTALFTVLMLAAGVRFHLEQRESAAADSVRPATAVSQAKGATPRPATTR